jgi:hypothetical protein
MKLPAELPTDPEEIERLYEAYAQTEEGFDEAEMQRLIQARLAARGLDPQHLTPDQAFSAMAASMSSLLLSLYRARDGAPDVETGRQVDEVIRLAEELRQHIEAAAQDVKRDA